MPDINFQKIELNLIPKKGDEPVIFYASQYETARPFIADLMWGESEFEPGDDCYAEIDIRKNDDNLVVITDDVAIDNNEVSVVLPVQALTCIGKNLGQVKIYASDDHLVAALNFILEVQPDPLAGGVTSETAIDNLESQIDEIISGEGYLKSEDVAPVALSGSYNDLTDKPVIPDELSELTDVELTSPETNNSLFYDEAAQKWKNYAGLKYTSFQSYMTNYYNNSQVDALLALKADESSVYTKAEVDTLIDNIFPTFTASGDIASFTTALNKILVSVTADPLATTITRCGKNLFDVSDGNGNIMRGVTPAYDNDGGLTFTGTVSEVGWCGSWNIDITLPAGTYTFSFSNPEIDHNITFALDWSAKVVIDRGSASKTVTFSQPQRLNRITLNSNSDEVGQNININVKNFQIEVGSATAYESYNSQTVPVADATTLTTLSGVNNVFADTGSVTVQYKYMSM